SADVDVARPGRDRYAAERALAAIRIAGLDRPADRDVARVRGYVNFAAAVVIRGGSPRVTGRDRAVDGDAARSAINTDITPGVAVRAGGLASTYEPADPHAAR